MDEAADDGWHEGMDCPDGWQVRRTTAEDRAHGIHDYARESAGGGWLMEPIDPSWTPGRPRPTPVEEFKAPAFDGEEVSTRRVDTGRSCGRSHFRFY